MYRTALAAILALTLPAAAAEAQSSRYFARSKLSGLVLAGPNKPTTYSGTWRLDSTGRFCPEGYDEVLLHCSDAGGKDLPYSSCDPAKILYVSPPCQF